MLENGLVKPEDQPRFLNRIHQEADRLVALISDILRLSQLDEGGALPHEQVSVLELAQEAARSLTAQAAAQAVHISVTGTAGTVFGVRRLLYEIARNLCENAAKYNVPGGSVTGGGVGDGAGRDPLGSGYRHRHREDQSRVFERFYRVDKSHSGPLCGTGLGLSIVNTP
ncbi:MAG: sensor histidine kinase [Dysosmobacter sp.]